MSDQTDFIAAVKAEAAQDKADLERTIETDRTRRYFAKDDSSVSGVFEGLFLVAVMALVPFLAFAGLALWSFGALNDHDAVPWVFIGLSIAIPIFVFVRAMRSKSNAPASMLADMMGAFWVGVFPFVLVGAIVVFAVATWLGVSFQFALALLIVAGIVLFALANQ